MTLEGLERRRGLVGREWTQCRMQAQQASLLVYHMRLLPIVLVALSAQRATACTAVVAGRKATANGATLLLHTDDCLDCDFRLARVPPLSASAVAQPEPVRIFRE